MKKEKYEFNIPKEVREISETLQHARFENFLVGGSVRDLVLGRVPKDWDITTMATPEEIIGLFPKTFYENEFGTVGIVNENTEDETIKTVEVTPFRLESGYSDARHPDKVEWGKNVKDDLARRDFTVNAMAYDFATGKIIDPFNGLEDIKKKTIRAVGNPDERFTEDALRMLRALRLASELNFALELETQKAIEKKSELLSRISKERVRDELLKIVLSNSPALALDLSARLGLLEYISPEFEKGIGMEQNQAHAYSVWEHLLRTLDHSAIKKFPTHVRLAAFFHDVAKPHTRAWKNNQWTFYGHEVVGAKLTRKIMGDLKFPKEMIDKTAKLVRWHMFFSDTEKITPSAVRRIVRNVGEDLIWDLVNLRTSDRIGTGRPKETPYRLRKYKSMIEEVLRDPISVKQLNLNGADIMKLAGTKPGPHIGFILEILLSEVLENPAKNDKTQLEKKVLELHALSEEELTRLGKEAREKNQTEEEKEVEKIREDYKVE